MYNITSQIIKYNSYMDDRIGMLILDVNYDFVQKEAIRYGRLKDVICIDTSR